VPDVVASQRGVRIIAVGTRRIRLSVPRPCSLRFISCSASRAARLVEPGSCVSEPLLEFLPAETLRGGMWALLGFTFYVLNLPPS